MQRIDYTSKHSMELVTKEGYREAAISVALRCTASSLPGSFDPRHGGEPPAGPEFEVVGISFTDEKNVDQDFPEELARQFFGEEIMDGIIDDAFIQGAETGEF